MGIGIKIFLYYVLLPLVVIVLAFCFFSTPILRQIGTERGKFDQEVWNKEELLSAKEHQAVIINLQTTNQWEFSLNGKEISGTVCFMLDKAKEFIISVKNAKSGLMIDKVSINLKEIRPGDFIGCEWIGNNSRECKSLKICIYHSDYTFEKIPVIFQNPFRL